MNEPDWAKILKCLHNNNGEIRRTALSDELSKEEVTPEIQEEALYDGLRENVELLNKETQEIAEMREHLQNTGLVSYDNNKEYAALQLTTDGFEVAHERELSRRDNRINQSLVFFTFVLVLAQIVDVIPADDWVKVLSAFIILVGMLAVTIYTDILSI
ncbi:MULTISPECIES: hypothetical protein [Haloarcula]|uniref:Uncharacterized protein n=1 Tax=Haloarcula japonica (strain ATCC 49778 / DSM 6131 / JCM 7785 / NBRC 101032 / NCIMB 13157 / TR-1) TaxID=1227453 RepID=M0LD43_HALJT|nr:hypothetical protein [Haloarcula japonica]EMA29885.1 hypothetical protein C444_13837 [Haloarcula japonica DSM 6131]